MNHVTYIAKTNFHKSILFGIKDSDRSGHIYCIGKTGVGKSTLLLNMVMSDVYLGKGVGVLDPHGDLSLSILDFIPKHRIKDTIYLNPAEKKRPLSFNPLKSVHPDNYHRVASSLVLTFKKVWVDSWGPRLEHILRNCILSLLYYDKATLLDIQRLLTSVEFRNSVINHVTDQVLRDFWYKEFLPMPAYLKAEAISPILNKVGILSSHPIIRGIIGNEPSTIDFSKIMDSKKIFIANLSKGILGEEGSQFLGALILTQFQTASIQRAMINLENRIPFYLFIDEMHSFITMSLADILSESRKYGLCLFLTHQYTHQLIDDIRFAILGNIGTIICFRIGAEDAVILEKEFHPVFTKHDLTSLPQYSIYLKLLIDGTTSQPFSATTLPNRFPKKGYKNLIIKFSIEKYGTPKTAGNGKLENLNLFNQSQY